MRATLFTGEVLRKLDRLELVARKELVGQRRGSRQAVRRGGSVEFADHRAYVMGDDLRYVDWSIYRRLGQLAVKLFEAEEDVELALFLDATRSMSAFPGPASSARSKFDQARLLVGALAYVALGSLDAVRLNVAGQGTQPRLEPFYRGRSAAHAVLEAVDGLSADGEASDLAACVTATLPRGRTRGVAVIVSDCLLPPANLAAALRHVRRQRWQSVVLQVADADEARPRLGGRMTLVDAESGRQREVMLTPRLVAGFQAFVESRRREVAAVCLRAEAMHVLVSTTTSFEDVLLDLFRRRGLVR